MNSILHLALQHCPDSVELANANYTGDMQHKRLGLAFVRKTWLLDSTQTYLQVSSEWAQAKSEASQAKAVGDKNKQKSIGLVIRSLKQELKELGGQHYCGLLCIVGSHKEGCGQLQLQLAKDVELLKQMVLLPSNNLCGSSLIYKMFVLSVAPKINRHSKKDAGVDALCWAY